MIRIIGLVIWSVANGQVSASYHGFEGGYCTAYAQEPGFYADAGLWLYGNVRLLDGRLTHIEQALGKPSHSATDLVQIEREAEQYVLGGKVIVSGVHNPAHQRVAIVPLRWGAPRILVLSGGFEHHLGKELKDKPFRAARLWRYQFDECIDLVISRRAPDRKPTFALHNPTVDRLIEKIAAREMGAVLFKRT